MAQGALVAELQLLYRAAGRPSYRKISAEIRTHDHMRDTVSHETVGSILRGDVLARWTKVECVVRQLASMAVHRPDPDEEVIRFHALWSKAMESHEETQSASPSAGGESIRFPQAEPGAAPSADWPTPTELSPSGITPTGQAPHRNPDFTGRETLLDLIRTELTGNPWQPLILHGLGGVGKTQLAVEYFHRQADRYDLVWWIAAEDPSQATTSLAALGEHQDWEISMDMAQTARRVLSALEAGRFPWLIVFDNAGTPDELESLVPAAGGHVIVTTRDAAWLELGRPVEVDVFTRRESIELLRRRGHDVAFDEADQLAERLGDLPLALEQVAAMQSATRIRVQELLRQLEERAMGLLGSGRPSDYRGTVATAFMVAAERVRQDSVAAAQLLELLSCLGAEPISLTLLRSASGQLPPPLGRILDQSGPLNNAIWLLRRYGLVKVIDDGQRLQVHRLVQAIVRDTLSDEDREQAYANARRLLTTANPGNPHRALTWDLHAQIGPHLRPAQVIGSTDPDTRRMVVDQATYLYQIGDFEGSRRLSEEAWSTWTGQGTDDENIFACLRRLVAALYALGRHDESYQLTVNGWEQVRTHPRYGPDHIATLGIADILAVLHRVFGRYDEALALERDRVDRYCRIDGEDGPGTLWAKNNLAVSLRTLGNFAAAEEIDRRLVEIRREQLGNEDPATLLSVANLASDLYGLGWYAEALGLQRSIWPAYRDLLGRHPLVFRAWRTIVLGLRKTGQVAAALEEGSKLYAICQGHLGLDHEHSLAAMMTYANTLYAAGHVSRASSVAAEALDRYRRRFGERNPLTLAAATNQAIILRAAGERRRARHVCETSLQLLRQRLGPDHPYPIAAAVGVGNDLAMAHEEEAARRLLTRTLDEARRVHGPRHPDTLICAVNLGLLQLSQTDPAGEAMLKSSLDELRRALGHEHPLVVSVANGQRGECDIEPPPT